MRLPIAIASLTLAGAFYGCTATSAPEEAVFQRTVVHLDGDRPPVVSTSAVTASEQRAQLAALTQAAPSGVRQEAITSDASCMGSSMWLHDRPNQTGNELCFFGQGTANLANFADSVIPDAGGGNSWSGNVRSYWAGSSTGSFWGPSQQAGQLFCSSGFVAYQRANSVDDCTIAARQLNLAN